SRLAAPARSSTPGGRTDYFWPGRELPELAILLDHIGGKFPIQAVLGSSGPGSCQSLARADEPGDRGNYQPMGIWRRAVAVARIRARGSEPRRQAVRPSH